MSLAIIPRGPEQQTDGEFSSWKIEGPALEIRLRDDVIEGISNDIIAASEGETDGALLGRRQPGDPEILWVEGFEKLTAAVDSPGDAVGFYRGTASPQGFADSDGPAESLLIMISPDSSGSLTAHLFLPNDTGASEAREPAFPFRTAPHSRPRRLVPDFERAADPAEPARDLSVHSKVAEPDSTNEDPPDPPGILRRYWPVFAALLLAGAAVWVLPGILSKQPPGRPAVPPVTATRPLGLYVEPAGATWQVSWNRDASVLRGAARVRLFIHDGDEQNSIDISPEGVEAGMYQYQPRGNDVAFRLEAMAADGRVSAESFRLIQSDGPRAASPSTAGRASPGNAPPRAIAPRAIHRVAPLLAAKLRPRIRDKILINVSVQVDTRGRVISAVPVPRPRGDLETSLAASAVRAAKAWRFEPARREGKTVNGNQTLHFVFER